MSYNTKHKLYGAQHRNTIFFFPLCIISVLLLAIKSMYLEKNFSQKNEIKWYHDHYARVGVLMTITNMVGYKSRCYCLVKKVCKLIGLKRIKNLCSYWSKRILPSIARKDLQLTIFISKYILKGKTKIIRKTIH